MIPKKYICSCNTCDNKIEFESTEVGNFIICPKCKINTKLFIPGNNPILSIPDSPPLLKQNIDDNQFATIKSRFKISTHGLMCELIGTILLLFTLIYIPCGLVGIILIFLGPTGISLQRVCSKCGSADINIKSCHNCKAYFR